MGMDPIAVTAADLWHAYDMNPIQADDKYMGKRVKLSILFDGSSSKLYRDGDKDYIGVVAATVDGVPVGGVHCYIAADSKKAFAELKPVTKFSLVGTCSGMKKVSHKDFVVIIKDCSMAAMQTGTGTEIEGRITVNRKPMPQGRILFHAGNGEPVVGIVKAGKYRVEGVPVGMVKISVDGDGLPKKYANKDTSGLAVHVNVGTNEFNVDVFDR